MEATPAEVSSTERIPSQTIELSGMIHRRPIRVLLDSGSTGNYISDHVAHSFNLIVQSEERTEQLTLADGSKYMRRDMSPYDCGVLNITVKRLPGFSLTCINN